jgi:hypothetical protein
MSDIEQNKPFELTDYEIKAIAALRDAAESNKSENPDASARLTRAADNMEQREIPFVYDFLINGELKEGDVLYSSIGKPFEFDVTGQRINLSTSCYVLTPDGEREVAFIVRDGERVATSKARYGVLVPGGDDTIEVGNDTTD